MTNTLTSEDRSFMINYLMTFDLFDLEHLQQKDDTQLQDLYVVCCRIREGFYSKKKGGKK